MTWPTLRINWALSLRFQNMISYIYFGIYTSHFTFLPQINSRILFWSYLGEDLIHRTTTVTALQAFQETTTSNIIEFLFQLFRCMIDNRKYIYVAILHLKCHFIPMFLCFYVCYCWYRESWLYMMLWHIDKDARTITYFSWISKHVQVTDELESFN